MPVKILANPTVGDCPGFGLWLHEEGIQPFNIVSYQHQTFQRIRSHFYIDDEIFSASWSLEPSSRKHKSSGKSGSSFLFSTNRHFMIKTIKSEEKKTLFNISNQLEEVRSCNDNNGSI